MESVLKQHTEQIGKMGDDINTIKNKQKIYFYRLKTVENDLSDIKNDTKYIRKYIAKTIIGAGVSIFVTLFTGVILYAILGG